MLLDGANRDFQDAKRSDVDGIKNMALMKGSLTLDLHGEAR
jgi:hypothetical protein